MTICEDGHDEIVFDGRECPLCNEIEKRKELEKEIEKLGDDQHKSLEKG